MTKKRQTFRREKCSKAPRKRRVNVTTTVDDDVIGDNNITGDNVKFILKITDEMTISDCLKELKENTDYKDKSDYTIKKEIGAGGKIATIRQLREKIKEQREASEKRDRNDNEDTKISQNVIVHDNANVVINRVTDNVVEDNIIDAKLDSLGVNVIVIHLLLIWSRKDEGKSPTTILSSTTAEELWKELVKYAKKMEPTENWSECEEKNAAHLISCFKSKDETGMPELNNIHIIKRSQTALTL